MDRMEISPRKEKKYLKLFRKLVVKYSNITKELKKMKIDYDVRIRIKSFILKSLERIRDFYLSIESIEGKSNADLLYFLGIEANNFNVVIREFRYFLGDSNLDIIEDIIDYINYKIGNTLKV